jgi:RNA polymerase sigma-70 factor (ECF subfamily)
MRAIEDRDAIEAFPELRTRRGVFAPFGAPRSVVACLAHQGGDFDHKDLVLRALVEEVQQGAAPRLAYSLLLLCLWPGLDAAFRRRLHLFRRQPEDLTVELIDRFTTEVSRLDLDRVTRVAATLVRNTEREVVVWRCRELRVAARSRALSPEVAVAGPAEPYLSPFGLNVCDSDDDSIRTIRCWLERAIGRDADLLVQVVVHGRSRSELAAVLGTSRDTLDKRVQRALGRARRALDVDSLSAPAIDLAFAST